MMSDEQLDMALTELLNECENISNSRKLEYAHELAMQQQIIQQNILEEQHQENLMRLQLQEIDDSIQFRISNMTPKNAELAQAFLNEVADLKESATASFWTGGKLRVEKKTPKKKETKKKK